MSERRPRLDKALIIDFEATCWEREEDRPPEADQEIIEVGLVEVDMAERMVTRSERMLVRPMTMPSAYCTQLTGIDEPLLRRHGRPWREISSRLVKTYGSMSKPWISWGRDDRMVMRQSILTGLPNPFSDFHLDLGMLYSLSRGLEKRVGLQQAIHEVLGREFHGRPHSGLDDALNTADVFLQMSLSLRSSLVFEEEPTCPRPMP